MDVRRSVEPVTTLNELAEQTGISAAQLIRLGALLPGLLAGMGDTGWDDAGQLQLDQHYERVATSRELVQLTQKEQAAVDEARLVAELQASSAAAPTVAAPAKLVKEQEQEQEPELPFSTIPPIGSYRDGSADPSVAATSHLNLVPPAWAPDAELAAALAESLRLSSDNRGAA